MTDDSKSIILISIILFILMVGVFIAATTEKANAQVPGVSYCPTGHTVDYDSANDATFNGYYRSEGTRLNSSH